MKIEDNRNDTRKFSELIIGDVFSCSGNVYIKTYKVQDDCDVVNAVNLRTGTFNFFDDDFSDIELLDDVTLVLN